MRHGYHGDAIGDYVAVCGRPAIQPFVDVPLTVADASFVRALEFIAPGDGPDVRIGYNPSFVDVRSAGEYVLRYEQLARLVRSQAPGTRIVFGDTIEGMDFSKLLDRWPEPDLIDVLDLGYYDVTSTAARVKLGEALDYAGGQKIPVVFGTVVFKNGASVAKVKNLTKTIRSSPAVIESVTVQDIDFSRDRHLSIWGDCRVTTNPDVLSAWADLCQDRD